MKPIAKFSKVSFEQFKKDFKEDLICVGYVLSNKEIEELVKDYYDNIKLPARATNGSSGHDFFIPFNIKLTPGESVVIPTGIRCNIYGMYWEEEEDKRLFSLDLYPKSGLGFKYKLRLKNTVGRAA